MLLLLHWCYLVVHNDAAELFKDEFIVFVVWTKNDRNHNKRDLGIPGTRITKSRLTCEVRDMF